VKFSLDKTILSHYQGNVFLELQADVGVLTDNVDVYRKLLFELFAQSFFPRYSSVIDCYFVTLCMCMCVFIFHCMIYIIN